MLIVKDTIYVGDSSRTNQGGIQKLKETFEPLGAEVKVIKVSKALHLKTGVTALPDGSFIGWPDFLDNVTDFPSFTAVSEVSGANVVCPGGEFVFIDESATDTIELMREKGFTPIPICNSEFKKINGSLTCLSVRVT